MWLICHLWHVMSKLLNQSTSKDDAGHFFIHHHPHSKAQADLPESGRHALEVIREPELYFVEAAS